MPSSLLTVLKALCHLKKEVLSLRVYGSEGIFDPGKITITHYDMNLYYIPKIDCIPLRLINIVHLKQITIRKTHVTSESNITAGTG